MEHNDEIVELLDDLEIDFALNSHHPMTHLEVSSKINSETEAQSNTEEIQAGFLGCKSY